MSQYHLWNDRIVAYLHDPPDKPLDIKGHVRRTLRYAELASGREVSHLEAETGASKWADIRASEIERLPLPNPGEHYQRAVSPHQGLLEITHPLSGGRRTLDCSSWKKDAVEHALAEIFQSIENPQARFMALWRFLPEKLAQDQPFFRHLPAETRVPDHTIWHHLDTASMLYSAYARNERLAFLSLSLGPVQGFIAASRSLRDLWTSSMLLSWLAFQSMTPILADQGPTALVFPQLRGNPLMDLWLGSEFPELKALLTVSKAARKSPCLPNRFVALLPENNAEDMAVACEQALRQAWRRVASQVRKRRERHFTDLDREWDRFWQGQVDDYFEVYTAVLPWQSCTDESLAELYGAEDFESIYPEAANIRGLEKLMPEAERPDYSQDSAGRWQARMELLGRLLETRKQMRTQPRYYPPVPTPPKCSLLGSYEQMGPVSLAESSQFWEAASQISGWTRIRSGERFSAIALIKRFAAEDFLLDTLELEKADLGFWDTATLAAIDWLRRHRIDPQKIRQETGEWSGQWLHAASRSLSETESIPEKAWYQIHAAKKTGPELPPNYYAVLMIDGDEMGKWLQGEKTPELRKSYHPRIVEYFRGLKAEQTLKCRKSVTPALHASISEALANFALSVAPKIVEKHRGILIYAGGDDVLALLPTHTALACARELRGAFRGEVAYNQGAPEGYYQLNGQELLMMGPAATLSAGLVIVHYKEDLRLALNLAREAEKTAKHLGRNALALTAARRSGERATVLALWEQLDWMQAWVDLFKPVSENVKFDAPLSNAWAYHLRETLPVMKGWTLPMMKAELSRQINCLENAQRLSAWFAKQNLSGEDPGQCMSVWFERYLQAHQYHLDQREDKRPEDFRDFEPRMLEQFILLCQSLAFLARGREE